MSIYVDDRLLMLFFLGTMLIFDRIIYFTIYNSLKNKKEQRSSKEHRSRPFSLSSLRIIIKAFCSPYKKDQVIQRLSQHQATHNS